MLRHFDLTRDTAIGIRFIAVVVICFVIGQIVAGGGRDLWVSGGENLNLGRFKFGGCGGKGGDFMSRDDPSTRPSSECPTGRQVG